MASGIDGLTMAILALVILSFGSGFGLQGGYSVLFVGLLVFLLEPLLVSFTGGSFGHHILGIKVVDKASGKPINIFPAIIRFVIKILFGTFAFLSINTTKQYQALHDLSVGSIVVLKNPNNLRAHEILGENIIEEEGYMYPSSVRRISMMLAYNSMTFVLLSISNVLFLSESCLYENMCSEFEYITSLIMSMLWIILIFAIVILCWKGLLFGCRRISSDQP